ncbi:unnamed protein product [Pleuronectes platessa]|uniref:Uncharacterized protein n=1 Tax=Pleuronectes platessa TaxID=8262 RepID=A0A9N7TWW1_PLEPL|nr:unnamed protein product [Pleuronectes platessa]
MTHLRRAAQAKQPGHSRAGKNSGMHREQKVPWSGGSEDEEVEDEEVEDEEVEDEEVEDAGKMLRQVQIKRLPVAMQSKGKHPNTSPASSSRVNGRVMEFSRFHDPAGPQASERLQPFADRITSEAPLQPFSPDTGRGAPVQV